MRERGVVDDVCQLPPGIILEGAGDCIWDAAAPVWLGCGFRSDAAAAFFLTQRLDRPVALPLAQSRFYHLDTALCVLPCGTLMYHPEALTPAAQATINAHVAPEHRIALDRADAKRFAANAVCVHDTIVLSSCSKPLGSALQERGYTVVQTPLQAFLRSGGSACCLTLRLDHRSAVLSARWRSTKGGCVKRFSISRGPAQRLVATDNAHPPCRGRTSPEVQAQSAVRRGTAVLLLPPLPPLARSRPPPLRGK